MTFVLEKVVDAEIDSNGLREINKKFHFNESTYEWIIDRAKNVYLRYMGMDWQNPQVTYFSFCWKGREMRLDLEMDADRMSDGTVVVKWNAINRKTPGVLPLKTELEPFRAELTKDLKEALSAYVEIRHTAKSKSYKKIAAFGF